MDQSEFCEEVDLGQGLFRLAVLPDETKVALNWTLKTIGDRLVEKLNEGIPCYQGSPD